MFKKMTAISVLLCSDLNLSSFQSREQCTKPNLMHLHFTRFAKRLNLHFGNLLGDGSYDISEKNKGR